MICTIFTNMEHGRTSELFRLTFTPSQWAAIQRQLDAARCNRHTAWLADDIQSALAIGREFPRRCSVAGCGSRNLTRFARMDGENTVRAFCSACARVEFGR